MQKNENVTDLCRKRRRGSRTRFGGSSAPFLPYKRLRPGARLRFPAHVARTRFPHSLAGLSPGEQAGPRRLIVFKCSLIEPGKRRCDKNRLIRGFIGERKPGTASLGPRRDSPGPREPLVPSYNLSRFLRRRINAALDLQPHKRVEIARPTAPAPPAQGAAHVPTVQNALYLYSSPPPHSGRGWVII